MKTQILKENKAQLDFLCKQNNVVKLYVFGSVLTEDFDEKNSDIDFLVEINKDIADIEIGESMLNLWNGLEKTFSLPVDLLRLENIRNSILLNEINNSKVLVYAA